MKLRMSTKLSDERYRLFNLPRAENLTSDPTVVSTVLENLISYLNYTLKQLYKVDLMSTLPTSKLRLILESNSLKIP